MDKAIELKNEALALIAAGNGETERMNEILRELADMISAGVSVTVSRACLNRVASAL